MHDTTAIVTAPAPTPIASPFSPFHLIWAPIIVVLGLVLSAAWTGLLGYGLFMLVE